MKSKNLLLQVFITAAGLLLLGGLGIYWPTLVGAGVVGSSSDPAATIADAITYQGYLTDENDVPLNGTYLMRFVIFNDEIAGTTLWDSGDINVSVNDGLFETRFPINDDIFNGEELWVSQTVNSETLTPRQEILPAPMAHTLRPGAIIKGTASAISNNYTIEVHLDNDAFAFNRGAIAAQTTTGNAIYSLAPNGRAVYGQTSDGYAIYGFDGGSNANRGYAGYFYSTNGVGVYGYSGGNRGFTNIFAPGVYGQSNQGVGVYGRGDTSDSHAFYNEGGRFEGGTGVYGRGTDSDGYGAEFYSQYRGMFAQSNASYYDGYFGNGAGISASNVVDRGGSAQSLVVNLGKNNIEPGDLVAMVGVTNSPENGQPMLAVAKVDATNQHAVIGVAKEMVTAVSVALDDGSDYIDFSPATGTIAPNDYLIIITAGLAPAVNLDSLALITNGQIGDKITLSSAGQLTLSDHTANNITVGKIAGSIDEVTGTIPVFIDID